MSKGAIAKETDEIKSKLLVKGNEEEEEEKQVLLPRKDSDLGKKNQKVQWNDKHLTQVLEYQPSEASEFEDEEPDACICNIM